MRQTKLVEIFNEQVLLSERDAGDVIMTSNMRIEGNPQTQTLLELAQILESGLRYAIKQLKWYELKKRFRYKRKFNVRYLIKNLGAATELPKLAGEVLKLEGIDIDKLIEDEKKKMESNTTLT